MASQAEIDARLIVHHRDTKTGQIKRTTPYQRHVVNGIVTYIDKKTGLEYTENWEAKAKPVEVAKAVIETSVKDEEKTEKKKA